MEDMITLFEKIEALLAEPGEGEPALARIENTLTEGYARALALEAERWRLERRIADVAAKLAEGDRERRTDEIASLAQRVSSADGDLSALRNRLATLRRTAHEVRTTLSA